MNKKRQSDNDLVGLSPAQPAGKLHQLVTLMRAKRGNNKQVAKANIRAWIQHGLRVGMSYDELKALVIEEIRHHKSK